jgi:crossover junction endodeoxyribonuclease RusA
LSARGREYRKTALWEIKAQRVPNFGTYRLKVSMILRPRDKRKCDLDNYCKAVLDALQKAGVYEDDWQIDHLEMIRGEPIKDGSIAITIESIDGQLPMSQDMSA